MSSELTSGSGRPTTSELWRHLNVLGDHQWPKVQPKWALKVFSSLLVMNPRTIWTQFVQCRSSWKFMVHGPSTQPWNSMNLSFSVLCPPLLLLKEFLIFFSYRQLIVRDLTHMLQFSRSIKDWVPYCLQIRGLILYPNALIKEMLRTGCSD